MSDYCLYHYRSRLLQFIWKKKMDLELRWLALNRVQSNLPSSHYIVAWSSWEIVSFFLSFFIIYEILLQNDILDILKFIALNISIIFLSTGMLRGPFLSIWGGVRCWPEGHAPRIPWLYSQMRMPCALSWLSQFFIKTIAKAYPNLSIKFICLINLLFCDCLI